MCGICLGPVKLTCLLWCAFLQGEQNAFSVMQGAFSSRAVKKFLVKEGVPVPGDGEQAPSAPAA